MITQRRILITGAEGFVGRWAVMRFSEALSQSQIRAVGHALPSGVDITDASAVDRIVAEFRPTVVLHLAGLSSPVRAQQDPRLAWKVNLFGTMNLAEAVIRHAPEARFIHASSSEVYAGSYNALDGMADERTLLAPLNPYASTKAAADLLLGQLAETGLAAVRFRPFNHTGPGQSTAFVVPSFAAQIAAIERQQRPAVLKVGNLDARRDFLDVRDVVDAYASAIVTPSLPNGIVLNLASGQSRRIGDVLEALLRFSSVPIRVEQDESLMRPNDVPVAGGDASRVRELLDWRPKIPWAKTLRDVLEDHRHR